jgi:EAL domain-containing protein (putative c-di-GMP-specific phosphodiesterase class I)
MNTYQYNKQENKTDTPNIGHALPLIDCPVIADACYLEQGMYQATYQNLSLHTAYQPIYSIDHHKIIGYEALIRAKNEENENVSPETLFEQVKSNEDSVYLDRLCRYIHVANTEHFGGNDDCWLFLNVSSLVCEKGREYGAFFANLLAYFSIKASNVVVEIIEDNNVDNETFLAAINYYKSLGCLIAIDDFGAGHSNFERVWNLKPDIVKLDRSILMRAVVSKHTRQLLSSIVSLLHQAGCLVVIEGVEDKEQALIAMSSGADFVQGYYFSKPQKPHYIHNHNKENFQELLQQYISSEQQVLANETTYLAKCRELFTLVVESLQQGLTLKQSASYFHFLRNASRTFLLDDNGVQQGENILFRINKIQKYKCFKPLNTSESINWFRKPYVRNAIKYPNVIHISDPYQSITGEGVCITLSRYFETDNGPRILCLDLIVD